MQVNLINMYRNPSTSLNRFEIQTKKKNLKIKDIMSHIFSFESVHLLVGCFCFVLVIILSSIILGNYFAFETTTNTNLYLPAEGTMVAITICVDYAISATEVMRKFPKEALSYEDFVTDWKLRLNLDQLDALTPQFADVVGQCEIIYPWTLGYSGCDVISDVIVSIGYYRKCFTLYGTNRTSLRYQREGLFRSYVTEFTLIDRGDNSHTSFKIHSINEPLDIVEGEAGYMSTQRGLLLGNYLTWETLVINRLPAPYDTNCFDYSTSNCSTFNNCLRQCVVSYYYREYGKWPQGYMAIIRPETSKSMFDYRRNYWSIIRRCWSIFYRKDCRETLHFIKNKRNLMNELQSINDSNSNYLVRFYLPQGLCQEIRYEPSLLLISLTSYIMGLINFTTGFAVIGSIFKITEYLERLIEKHAWRLKSLIRSNMNLNEFIWSLRRNVLTLRTVFSLISAYFAFIQIIDLYTMYIKFETKTDVYTFIAQREILPVISVCFKYNETLFGRNVETIINSAGKYEDFVMSCEVLLPNSTLVPCEAITLPENQITDYWKCFRMFNDGDLATRYKYNRIKGKTLVNLKLNLTQVDTKYVWLTLMERGKHPMDSPEFTGTIELDAVLIKKLSVTFEIFSNVLLRSPYNPYCVDYEETFNVCYSDISCIEQCVQEKFIKDYHLIPDNIFVRMDQNISNLTFPFRNLGYRMPRLQLRDTCGKKLG